MCYYIGLTAFKVLEGSPTQKITDQEQGEIPQAVKLAVLISNQGSGTNLQAIIDAIGRGDLKAQIGLVISDQPDAKGLERARNNQIPEIVMELHDRKMRDFYSRTLAQTLNKEGIQIAVLAGFMTILSPSFLEEFRGVTINIHPGAVPFAEDRPYFTEDGKESPWNKKMMTDDAVQVFLDKGLKYAVSTVHVITGEPDFGPVLERGIEEIQPGDDVATLYARLKLKEHAALIRALQKPDVIFNRAGKSLEQFGPKSV